MSDNTQFHIFGLQRSGTNYLEQLVTQNFRGVSFPVYIGRFRIWKHGFEFEPKAIEALSMHKTLILYKHPYKWIESVFFNPKDIIETHKIEADSYTLDSDTLCNILTRYDLKKMVDLYNRYYSYYLQFNSNPNFTYYRFRNVFLHPEEYLNFISLYYKLPKPDRWIVPEKVPESNRIMTQTDREEYTHVRVKLLNSTQIKRINELLDLRVINRLRIELFY